MFDLPGTPSFPVYGLDDGFAGYRWLVIWNDAQLLYMVSLGHGHPEPVQRGDHQERSDWLTVSTYLKTPRREVNDGPPVAVGPTGYQDALFGGLVELAERVPPNARRGPEWVSEQINRVDRGGADERDAPAHHGPGWVDAVTVVGGQRCASVSLRLDGWWTTLVDLPSVAITITGPDSMSDLVSVVDVRTRLTEYH